ncbi:hypothetical protein PUNSTDRAFT_100257 [Punctularia strigosozonata HHB-11173 SS5]|uniref:uncharacterized protein n=1 Tax=Punctularia strigosozonata (strain HHB-11173) TaxID=741275 RepID=UPI0004416799|nr:uncharacterized protein PUNSTDRAFT_100257 [Punctularia strigosozonata HHB-11173 SS5]EIN10612.1 hypothetical protein PUNSTDRAFT_100257 [Punctularia strigosozonata HHB-11173 SS5]
MSENTRQVGASPISSSPGRSYPLARPHWPWSTYTHRSSSSTPSIASSHGHARTSTLSGSWEPRSLGSSTMTGTSTPGGAPQAFVRQDSVFNVAAQDDAMRHWTFTAFEWVVRDVRRLKDFVEADHVDGASAPSEYDRVHEDTSSSFGVFRDSPLLGDGKFKLEIGMLAPVLKTLRSHIPAMSSTSIQSNPGSERILVLSITSLMVDFHQADYDASIMVAIKCQDDKAGERGARPAWVWEAWQNEWTFRSDSEVWECPLPSLSSLLENYRINSSDSFVICVQIHSPLGPFFPQQPSAYYVPRDLLEGLEASLDNANTGDVRFVCLERSFEDAASGEIPPSPSLSTQSSRRSSSGSASTPFLPHLTARKRTIYAHSDILIRRSEYFATMLSSAFAETSQGIVPGERKVYTIVVEEADFNTIYWLLKWIYGNWLLFRDDDDPREAVSGTGAGWSTKWLHSRGNEWDWKTFSKSVASIGSVRSATSGHQDQSSAGDKGKQTDRSRNIVSASTPSITRSTTSKPTMPGITSRQSSGVTTLRHGAPSSGSTTTSVMAGGVSSSSSNQAKSVPLPSSYPLSPRASRHPASTPSIPDPHPHPTPPPPPASALSVYQVAHRYAIPGLASLALEHMMATLTPARSFALLLATSLWDELHALVEDYVVERWEEVAVTPEFESCCVEVAAGEWGTEGGKTLTALFRRLRSPLGFSRS